MKFFSLLFILFSLLDLFFPGPWQICNLMARALPWQRSDRGLKSMEPMRDEEPRSLTAMWGTDHHCSPSQLWSFFMLILMVPLCGSHRGQAPQRPKTLEFINPKGRPIRTRALGNYFEFHGVLSGSERSTHNYNPSPYCCPFVSSGVSGTQESVWVSYALTFWTCHAENQGICKNCVLE